MERKSLVMMFLCVAIGVMAIAYAIFSTTLNITGTIESTSDFKVEFTLDSVTCTPTKVDNSLDTRATFTKKSSTSGTIDAYLYTPGDVITCTIPLKNTGTLPAKLNGEVTISPTPAADGPIAISVTDAPATLEKDVTSNIIVKIMYDWDGNEQPTGNTSPTFTLSANYIQDVAS